MPPPRKISIARRRVGSGRGVWSAHMVRYTPSRNSKSQDSERHVDPSQQPNLHPVADAHLFPQSFQG
jgi:hypothetical protein